MDQAITGKIAGKPRILVAPLDWGLGHATRCIPIIRGLLEQDCEVWIAADGAPEQLLREEFPNLPFLSLPGYRIRYAKSAAGLAWQLFKQVPKLIHIIKKEHNWLKIAVRRYSFDAVVSDNRYGLYHATIPSVFITHQLRIKTPRGGFVESWLQKLNYRWIDRFTECWVPDYAGGASLAKYLSQPPQLPSTPVHYVGVLTRFGLLQVVPGRNHLLFIISGPEPQRSLFENKIIEEISHYSGTATIVRGLPGHETMIPSTNMLQFHNHLNAGLLQQEIANAAYVISRSGYSTVMDMLSLQKKTILVPTPGQTEQEYLATELKNKKYAYSIGQANFSLTTALKEAADFNYQSPVYEDTGLLKKTITNFLRSIRE